jgi:hypothetical protein
MRNETATRNLTLRAMNFYGLRLSQYIEYFCVLKHMPDGQPYIWLNDNITMQKTFAVWVNHGDRKEKLMALLASK